VAHLSEEVLAGHALGQLDELSADQLRHVESCPQCRTEVDQLRRVVDLGQVRPDPVSEPPPVERMWQNIAAELSLGSDQESSPPATAQLRAEPMPQLAAPTAQRRGVRRWAVVLAAAVGLFAGAVGTVLVNALQEPQTEIVARATLNALPGEVGQGTAQLVQEQGATELRVSVTGAAPAQEYREVWLINTDGKRMYSLGVLPGGGSGSYPVPAGLGDQLDGFTIVDVSLEPYDGNAAHSQHSQVRGNLPV
jgi:anti-sigma-K factor RskA